MRAISTIFAMVLVGSAAYAGGVEVPQYHYDLHTKHYSPAKFDRIVADGYFNLKVLPKSGHAAVIATSYAQEPISVSVRNHTLYLTSSPLMYLHYKQHPNVVVRVPELNQLDVKGPVNVKANHLRTKGLSVMATGYGDIDINHIQNVSAIKQSGNNVIKVNGVNNRVMALNLKGYGKLSVNGRTDSLVARLNGDALLKARDLRANNVLIQAKYHANAFVRPLKSIRAFSSGSGEIFYYRYLTDLTRYSVQSGNAFQMSWT